MITHLLVDLDDTLLKNSMEEFAPPYYKALSTHLEELIPPKIMMNKLLEGTQAMLTNNNPSATLEQVFDNIFYPGVGLKKEILHPHIEYFYDDIFPTLKIYTKEIPDAVKMVGDALSLGKKIVIATNPLFPIKAIKHRLAWAGLDPVINQFTLITSYEVIHFTKPNPAYYQEILDLLGVKAQNCVMVGNDKEMDIIPARKIGIKTFHLAVNGTQPGEIIGDGIGSHSQVIPWIESIN